ncbi:MAG: hypothetical protein WA842_09045 [Croceibacterium sp.]
MLALAAGLRKFLVTFFSLAAFLLAIFVPIPAVYELWQVGKVDHWRQVPARLDAVERKKPAFGKGPSTWRFTLFDPEFGTSYETGDIEPGDFPFAIAGWSNTDRLARDYQQQAGQTIRVRRSPQGDQYFLEAGGRATMSILIGLCAIYWAWLLSALRRRKVPA